MIGEPLYETGDRVVDKYGEIVIVRVDEDNEEYYIVKEPSGVNCRVHSRHFTPV